MPLVDDNGEVFSGALALVGDDAGDAITRLDMVITAAAVHTQSQSFPAISFFLPELAFVIKQAGHLGSSFARGIHRRPNVTGGRPSLPRPNCPSIGRDRRPGV